MLRKEKENFPYFLVCKGLWNDDVGMERGTRARIEVALIHGKYFSEWGGSSTQIRRHVVLFLHLFFVGMPRRGLIRQDFWFDPNRGSGEV